MRFSILRILTSVLAAGLTMEFCARVEDTITHGAPFWGIYTQDMLYDRPGPDFEGVPGARYLKWHMNSLGYRGPEPAAGALRVVCIGASETFGLSEPENEEWPRQLETALRARFGPERPVTVVNAAYPGSNLRTHIHQAPRVLRQAKPDLAVIYTSVAAYVDASSYEVLKAAPLPRMQFRLLAKTQELRRKVVPLWLMTPLRQLSIERSLRGREDQVTNRIRPEHVDLFTADLNRLLDIYQAKNVPVLLVTHATYFGRQARSEDQSMLTAWRLFYPTLREEGFVDMEAQLNERMRQVAAERGVAVADAAAQMPAGAAYFTDFVHFTTAGAREMGRIVAAEASSLLERR